MKHRFILYVLVFMIGLKAWSQNGFVAKTVQILENSELSISGDTNISGFGCEFNTFYMEAYNEIRYNKVGDNIIFKNAVLSLKNEGFDCGSKGINKDFHSLLNTKEYPKITLELTEINLIDGDKSKACVKITIAGKEKGYIVPIAIITEPTHRFIGELKLDIRDFGLKPPKKMLGLIVIKEEIEIDFNLVAKL
ncbi:YceI family protein [Aequorivita capsosiphonis]|uniref:YceI family protein n=1 Tax=Aequorivita capsosiphonis TaxID=487317 RepID=UPI000407FE9F|nr:YceI family protein [Aequorivita capsosiphonis]